MAQVLTARRDDAVVVGMALMAASALTVPLLDVISKLLMERLPTAQVGAGRLLLQSLLVLPVMLAARQIAPPRPIHFVAGALLGLAIFSFNSGLREMPVANAIAIFFVEPLILTLLAGFLLREGIGWRRLTAVAVGLAGALLVLRPNVGAFGWAAAWPLAAACLYASYMTVSRVMSRTRTHLATQFWTVVAATLTLSALAFGLDAAGAAEAAFLVPTAREAWLFLAMAVFAAFVHQCVLLALARASATVLAPLRYLEIVAATGLGWLVFGDFPDAVTWLGTAVIVSAGIYVFHRERAPARQAGASAGRGASP